MSSILCPTQYQAWVDAYNEWVPLYNEALELQETALITDAEMGVVCGGALLTVETIVGGIVGGAACALMAWKLADAIDDLARGADAADAKAAEAAARQEAYDACVGSHKQDP